MTDKSDDKNVVVMLDKIGRLRATRSRLADELQAVNKQLNAYRGKCPTCRCKILPGDKCACCAQSYCDED